MDRGPQKGEGKKYLPQGEEPLHHSEDFYLLRTWSLHSSLSCFLCWLAYRCSWKRRLSPSLHLASIPIPGTWYILRTVSLGPLTYYLNNRKPGFSFGN